MTRSKYIRDLLPKTHMAKACSFSSPMVSNCKLSKFGANLFSDPTLNHSVVNPLQHATLTRLEISFAVNKVCQFMAKPLNSLWAHVKCII